MLWTAGFETTATADVHPVPGHAVRRSYGAVNELATPSASAVAEIVIDDSQQEHDESNVVAPDSEPQVDDASVQHSSSEVLVWVDLPAPDQTILGHFDILKFKFVHLM